MSECTDCERYKKSAALWRHKAYELVGKPLPWEPDEIWVGLTNEEIEQIQHSESGVGYELFDEGEYGTEINIYPEEFARAIEAKLKEKNS